MVAISCSAELYLGRLFGAEGFEKLVALKVIHSHLTEQEEFVKMFIDEARLASRIDHPNVAHILELGKVEQTHFIAMEYVNGESLVAILRKTRPDPRIAARIIADAAAGLHAAHELHNDEGELLNVVHRDVSPQNIIISYTGATKVIDFGVARARGSLHTTQGELKGKLAYMAPEQFKDTKRVDRRSDIFALGIVLFEASTRRRLFKAATEADQISKVLFHNITPPSAVFPEYPQELETIVMRALERDMADRFQTAQEMQLALEKYLANSGDPVLPSDVGKFMRDCFEERIGEKKRLLQQADISDVSEVMDAQLISGLSLPQASMGSLLRKRQRKTLLGVAGLLTLAALGVGLTLTLFNGGASDAKVALTADAKVVVSPDQRLIADTAPELITISVTATPLSAKLVLNGKAVKNPLKIEQPKSAGQSLLEISAPGYKSRKIEIPHERSGGWVIALNRDKPAKRVKRRRGKKKKKGKLGDADILASPYD
ncbi:MAG: serine/threonine protein kinase [Deltaproteobacteria bacterium]|nr:serine/threonine protein kinase [Deltaproteobacteria bacterium]